MSQPLPAGLVSSMISAVSPAPMEASLVHRPDTIACQRVRMHSSLATLTALHSPHSLGVFVERLGRYLRLPVDAHSFVVAIPGAGRVLVRSEAGCLTLSIVAADERGLAAAMGAIVGELEQGFGRSDFRRSIAVRWQRRDTVPTPLR